MPRMTGGQALARQLYREGVRVIFGLPGVQLYHLLDGLYEQSGIRFITTRHEQATTYMADGFSRAGGGIGTALVVPGPGLQNASAGIGTAYSASSPILVIAGQVEQDLIGVDRGVLHEINDQLDTIRPVIKWGRRILAAKDVPGSVHEAFHQLQSGRPRPVEIEIPPDTLAEEADVELVEPVDYQRPAAAAAEIQRGAELLAGASNPAIWAGGGVHLADAHPELLQVAEHLQAPVFATGEGRGAVSDRHYLSLGPISFGRDSYRDRRAAHDLIFAVGTRLATPGLLDGQQVLQLDIDAQEIGRNHERTAGMVGDARATLAALHELLAEMMPPRSSRQAELEALYAERFDGAEEPEPLKSFMRAIRAGTPDDGIIVQDFTQLGYYSRSHCPIYEPRSYITPSYFGTLGYGYPTALGAKVAKPDKAVVAISGDGGFLYNSQELATAVKYGIAAVVIVFNDNAYGNVLRDQRTRFGGRVYGSELHNPDFMKLADAYGVRGERVGDAAALEAALKRAVGSDAPTLIEVPVGELPTPY